MVYKRIKQPVDTGNVLIVKSVIGEDRITDRMTQGELAADDGADARTLVVVTNGCGYKFYLLCESPETIENRIKRAEIIYL